MKRTLTSILFLLSAVFMCAAPYWYKTQFSTGNPGNCGPASAAMMAYWGTGKDVSVQDARSKIGMPHRDGATSIADLERRIG